MKLKNLFLRGFAGILLTASASGACWAADKVDGPRLDLERIIVTPSRIDEEYRDSSANVAVIDGRQIAESGVNDISGILNTLPAVNIINYGSYGSTKAIHTRGASSSQVVTLVNGRRVNTPRDGETDHNQIPLNNIERVEVLRGPASSIYGANAVGGVINIITKSGGEKMFTEINSRMGSYSTWLAGLSHGWKINNLDYFISASAINSNGHRDNSDYQQENYNIKMGYDLKKDSRLTLETGYTASETGTPGRNSDVDLDDRQEQWKDFIDLTWEGSVWDETKVLLKLYQNTDRLEFIESLSPVLDKTTNQTKVYAADLQVSRTWFDIFRTTLGATGQENKLNSSSSAKHKYNFRAGYIETELNPFEDLTLKGGARVDDYSNFGSRASPSASFSWWLFDKIKTHGLAGKAFRAPTFNDLYWPREDYGVWGGVEGNANLKPETAFSREIGLGTFLFNRVEADVTYFYTKFKDMIAWTMDNTYWWRPTNVNTAVTKGLETSLNCALTKNIKLNLNYTRLSATDEITDKWLIYRPRHEYKGAIDYRLGENTNLYLTGRYLSKRYTVSDNSRFLKDYFAADANLSYKIFKCAQVSLTINNIFDRDYQEEEDYPMPGTSFLAGVKLSF